MLFAVTIHNLPSIWIGDRVNAVIQAELGNALIQDADGQEPIGIPGINLFPCPLIAPFHQWASFGALHEVTDNRQHIMFSECIGILEVKRFQAGDIHVRPPSAMLIQ